MLQAGDMGKKRQDKEPPLLVTLEYVETSDARTRLAHAIRLILTQSPSHVLDQAASASQKDKNAFKRDQKAGS
jgi:hypothetical protein